ncbi:MAG: hypothetical protein ACLRZ9_02645 [Eubacterium sp.]
MKNAIKKACAIVMTLVLLFTVTSSVPVSAACNHQNRTIGKYEYEKYITTTTHTVNNKVCTIYVYHHYTVTEWCQSCGAELVRTSYPVYKHTVDH